MWASQLSVYFFASSGERMTSRFSALCSSAAFVKLKLPVMTVASSIIMILLWAMACLASILVGMPTFTRKSTSLYFSDRWLLSMMAWTFTPRLWASSRALAIGADVKEYACIRTVDLALPSSLTTASVQPPFGREIDLDGRQAGLIGGYLGRGLPAAKEAEENEQKKTGQTAGHGIPFRAGKRLAWWGILRCERPQMSC